MNPLDRLKDQTYTIQYSPNCVSPFLVRLIGWRLGRLDLERVYSRSADILGFGKTLEEAVEKALAEKRIQDRRFPAPGHNVIFVEPRLVKRYGEQHFEVHTVLSNTVLLATAQGVFLHDEDGDPLHVAPHHVKRV